MTQANRVKTALMAPCFLDGNDPMGNDRLERYVRWLRYYLDIQHQLGFDRVVLFDNSSSLDRMHALADAVPHSYLKHPEHLMLESIHERVTIFRMEPNLVRGDGPHAYPYCWRALYGIKDLIRLGYRKVIAIDTDCFVLTHRAADYIRGLQSGWVSFWCESGGHPDSTIHVLSEDAFQVYQQYTSEPWEKKVGRMMEWDLPFTACTRDYRYSKFGEYRHPPQDDTMDVYGQASLKTELTFGRFM